MTARLKMKLIVAVLIVSVHYVCSENVKRFLANTNFWTPGNWKEGHAPCAGNEIVFPKRTPKIFLDGADKTYRLSKIILPEDGELILDNAMRLMAATFGTEDHECHSTESHYSKFEPDFWYNPVNWCSAANLTSKCLQKPQVEASMVPSAVDFVVFPPQSSIYVGVKQTEPRVLARKIYYRRQIYTNSIPFRLKIQRTSRNKLVEFVTVGSNSPPLFELRSVKSRKSTLFRNSNLEKMELICKYVSCTPPACVSRIRPQGGCCELCGHLMQVTLESRSENCRVIELVNGVLTDKYQSRVIFDVLWTDQKEFQITLSPWPADSKGGLDDIVSQIMKDITLKTESMGVKQIRCSTCQSSISQAGQSQVYIVFIVLIMIVVAALATVIIVKRFRPELVERLSTGLPQFPTVQMPAFNWYFVRGSFSRSRLSDRMEESLVEPAGISSIFTDGIEAIELPDTSHEVSFDNPIFSPQIDDSKH